MRTTKWMTALIGLLAVAACTPAVCCTTDNGGTIGNKSMPVEQFPAFAAGTGPATDQNNPPGNNAGNHPLPGDTSPGEVGDGNSPGTGAGTGEETGTDPGTDAGTDDESNPNGPDDSDDGANPDGSDGSNSGGQTTPLTVAVFGDIQGSFTDVWPEAAAGASTHPLDAALYVGDMIDTENDWAIWRQSAPNVPTFATPGNHEYTTDAVRDLQWDSLFSFPRNGPMTPWSPETCAFLHQSAMVLAAQNTVYEVDLGSVRVFSLNSNTSEARREISAANSTLREHGCSTSRAPHDIWLEFQRQWLADRLEAVAHANEDEYTVVMFHHPVIASKSGRSGEMIRDAWAATLASVDVVFTGHDHVYSRHQFAASSTQFLTMVSGRKFYPDTSMSDWNRAGITPIRWLDRTSIYGILTVDECLNFTAYQVQNRTSVDSFEICN